MLEPRIYAARTAARLLLRKLWDSRVQDEPGQVLSGAPSAAATHLGMRIKAVPGIAGGDLLAGAMDRLAREILISTRFPIESQRFTLAHELAHVILHPGITYFRDRSIEAPDLANERAYYEIEADAFAAEFLIPPKYLQEEFLERFGAPLDSADPAPELMEVLSKGRRRKPLPFECGTIPDLDRARAIASTSQYGLKTFTSLHRQFEVSRTAMAIQLLKTGLVR